MRDKRLSVHDPLRFLESQRFSALVTLDILGAAGGTYTLYQALTRGLGASAILLIGFLFLLLAGNLIFFANRRRLLGLTVFLSVTLLIIAVILDAGSFPGFGFFFLVPFFPLVFVLLGSFWGTALLLLGGLGSIARLLYGGYPSVSLFLPETLTFRLVLLVAYTTLTGFIVNLRVNFLTFQLTRLATTDIETGLSVKLGFESWLEARLSAPPTDGLEEGFSVIGFRILNYNNIYAMEGPALCEKVMRTVGERVRNWHNHVEISSRWQSSLFLSALGTNDFLEVDSSCRELLGELTQPIYIGDRTIVLLCSVAITRFPDDADSSEYLIGNVLSTLDRNSTMPDELIFFDRKKHDAERHRYRLFARLVKGDFSDGFSIQYQPKIRLKDGSCSGAEVLMRWNHPEFGSISPAEFIALAEEIGSIRRLTRTMIAQVFRDLSTPEYIAAAGNFAPLVAVNLSIQDLKDQDLLSFINREMRKTGITPAQIEFEITEGSLIDDNPWIRINMENLVVLGFHLAIDDFGTGYSSLSYLHRLKVHDLKIDQSFVRALEEGKMGADQSPVIDAIISMGKALGLEITAEGVETPYQADYLRHRGCDLVQGWLYSKSLPFAEFVSYLEAHSPG